MAISRMMTDKGLLGNLFLKREITLFAFSFVFQSFLLRHRDYNSKLNDLSERLYVTAMETGVSVFKVKFVEIMPFS